KPPALDTNHLALVDLHAPAPVLRLAVAHAQLQAYGDNAGIERPVIRDRSIGLSPERGNGDHRDDAEAESDWTGTTHAGPPGEKPPVLLLSVERPDPSESTAVAYHTLDGQSNGTGGIPMLALMLPESRHGSA